MRIAASDAMRNADEAADAIVHVATEIIRTGAPSTALTQSPSPPCG
jgi:hypothetical protein